MKSSCFHHKERSGPSATDTTPKRLGVALLLEMETKLDERTITNSATSRCLTECSPTGTRPLQPERDGLAREVRFVVANWEFSGPWFLKKPLNP